MDAQSRESLKHSTASLPLVEHSSPETYILDGAEALNVWAELRANDSAIPEHIQVQVDFVLEEVLDQLNTTPDGKNIILNRNEIRGALVRMAIRGTAQGLYDVGNVLHKSSEMDTMLLGHVEEPEL